MRAAAPSPTEPSICTKNQVTHANPPVYTAAMLATALTVAFLACSAVSGVSAHNAHDLRGLKMIRQNPSAPFSAAKFPDVQKVLEGNARFQQNRDAAALQSLVDDGQKPPFMMISCSDSR